MADIEKGDWDSFLNRLSQLQDLHHLDLSRMELFSVEAYTQLLLHLAPTGQHHWQTDRQPSKVARVRSFKFPEEVHFAPSLQVTLALYTPILEGFFCEALKERITGRQVVDMLRTCSRLKTMVVSNKLSGYGTQVCWRSFARGQVLGANLSSDSWPLDTAWPCAETLTVLSIFLKVDSTMISEEDSLQTAERIFRRLGELRVLEDLSLGCDHKRVGYRKSSAAFGIEVTLNWT
ncbi:hypothetical protein BGW39_002229, partial [Mortierella sp. 14UC]